MDAPELGKLIVDESSRDAIHIAIAPVTASQKLAPGENIGFVKEGCQELVGKCDSPIGIVDPFLERVVYQGQRFWMFLYPNTITSLRHNWSHPAFIAKNDLDRSREWLANFASQVEMDFDELVSATKSWIDEDNYIVQYGNDDWQDLFDDLRPEFWHHWERLFGPVSDEDKTGGPFTCSC